MPGHIDPNAQALQTMLNKTAAELEELSSRSIGDITVQAEEVQFHVVTVSVFVCLFVCFVFLFKLNANTDSSKPAVNLLNKNFAKIFFAIN